MYRSLLIIFFLFICASCTTRYMDAPSVLTNDSRYETIQQNDTVHIRIYGESDISGDYTVNSSGTVYLPIPGEIHIENLTLSKAAQKIAETLHDKHYFVHPKISVDIIKRQPIAVMGEVVKRGEYTFYPNITVYQAIAQAGGYTYRADRGHIILRRKDQKTHKTQLFTAREDTPLLPGDMIEISERYF